MKKASDLKIGDTFKKQGYKFTIVKITNEEYKNGVKSLLVECTMNDSKIVDSYFHFKTDTKIK